MAALYNTYRPRTFAEVRGQEHATEALIQALTSGRVHHAYLFSGPRGCGKTSSARILAASLNCETGPTPEPCGTCRHCVEIREGNSLDVVEIDAASHGGVDDTRDLRERAHFSPASARFKVYIIDEAHMITTAAFNALLKIVEEPPPHVKFIFATTEPDKVLVTIRSRSFHYHFRLVPPRVLIDHLASICAKEGATVDPAVLPLVVAAGGGSVRDALSVLDQLLAGSGPEGLTYYRAVGLLGLTDATLLDEALDALSGRDGAALFQVVDKVVSSGHDPKRFAQDLLELLRDLVVLHAVPDAAERGLLERIPADAMERMRGQANRLGAAELSRAADLLHAGLVEMRGTANPRLLLELVCARILLPAAASGEGSALAVRLDRLERRAEIGLVPPPVAAAKVDATTHPSAATEPATHPGRATATTAKQPPGAPAGWPHVTEIGGAPAAAADLPTESVVIAPAPGAPADLSPADLSKVRAMWPQVLEAIKTRKRVTHALVSQYAQVAALDSRALTLAFELPHIAAQFKQSINVDVTREALAEVLGVNVMIDVAVGGSPGDGASDAPAQPSAQAAGRAKSGASRSGKSRRDAAQAVPAFAPGDAAADDDEDEDEDGGGSGSGGSSRRGPAGEDAAMALLQEGLGATVIGQVEP